VKDTDGGFECPCISGYENVNETCVDINECDTTNNCSANGFCMNTSGSYGCECNNGYSGDGFTCEDINECEKQTDNCDENALCLNEEGSFS
jgi:hypothetical protein